MKPWVYVCQEPPRRRMHLPECIGRRYRKIGIPTATALFRDVGNSPLGFNLRRKRLPGAGISSPPRMGGLYPDRLYPRYIRMMRKPGILIDKDSA